MNIFIFLRLEVFVSLKLAQEVMHLLLIQKLKSKETSM